MGERDITRKRERGGENEREMEKMLTLGELDHFLNHSEGDRDELRSQGENDETQRKKTNSFTLSFPQTLVPLNRK